MEEKSMKGMEKVSSRGMLIIILLILIILGLALYFFGGQFLIRSILFPG